MTLRASLRRTIVECCLFLVVYTINTIIRRQNYSSDGESYISLAVYSDTRLLARYIIGLGSRSVYLVFAADTCVEACLFCQGWGSLGARSGMVIFTHQAKTITNVGMTCILVTAEHYYQLFAHDIMPGTGLLCLICLSSSVQEKWNNDATRRSTKVIAKCVILLATASRWTGLPR